MKEHKQIFVTMYCKLCSKETGKWGGKFETERKFISHVNEPNRFVCGNCGVFIHLTDEEIKRLEGKQGGGE